MSVKKILGAIRKADQDYQLIDDGDTIAIGISGGKDSMVLAYGLYLYQKWCTKGHLKSFDLIGIHLDLNFKPMDTQPIAAWFESFNITYVDIKTQIYDMLLLHKTNAGTIPCSLCSKFKKGAMVLESKKRGATKVAFAHHMDDAIETVLLNWIYGGRIATFDPKMFLSDQKIMFIRPLIYARESEVSLALDQANIPTIESGCPVDKTTKRESIKQLVKTIESTFPSARVNLPKGLTNVDKIHLFPPVKSKQD